MRNRGNITRQAVLTVALAALMTGSSLAATPRMHSEVTGDQVTLGDVFDGVTENTDYVLAPAPALGGFLTLNTHDLLRVSDAFHLGWQPSSGNEQVEIKRATHAVSQETIESAVEDKLSETLKGRKFDIEFTRHNLGFQLPESVSATIDVSDVKYDLARGEFSAVITAPAKAKTPLVKKEISGRMFTISSVPVLKSALRAGDVISADDIDYVDMRDEDLSANAVINIEKLVGMTPRRGISPMKPIVAGDVVMPVAVKKGETVTIELKSGALQLVTTGQALENGAEGETVRILNPSSNKMVQAVVTGPKTVAVLSPTTIIQ